MKSNELSERRCLPRPIETITADESFYKRVCMHLTQNAMLQTRASTSVYACTWPKMQCCGMPQAGMHPGCLPRPIETITADESFYKRVCMHLTQNAMLQTRASTSVYACTWPKMQCCGMPQAGMHPGFTVTKVLCEMDIFLFKGCGIIYVGAGSPKVPFFTAG